LDLDSLFFDTVKISKTVYWDLDSLFFDTVKISNLRFSTHWPLRSYFHPRR